MKMERTILMGVSIGLAAIVMIWVWRVANWVWFRPKKLESYLRGQGLTGNSYRLLYGDMREDSLLIKQAKSKPINFSHDILPRALPMVHQTVKKYGKNSFVWLGPVPRVLIMNPEQIRETFTKHNDFQKPHLNPLAALLITGVGKYEGEKWAKHRKILNPAFHQEKLKVMLLAFYQSCDEMISKWEKLVSAEGSCELDVFPHLTNLASDMISRTAFGSSYEEGKRIFELQGELTNLTLQVLASVYIPGWRFLPTKTNKRLKEINRELETSLKVIINKRENVMKTGEATNNDLLGILVESNFKEIQEYGNNKNSGINMKEVIEECKLFYFAGHKTTSSLFVWTMIMLAKYTNWQARAREEVLQIFGYNQPTFDGLNRLKVVTMILYEVIRLYPSASVLARSVHKEVKLGNLSIPAGIDLSFPIILIHRDHELWGDDAMEFNPERFSDGVAKATKSQVSFLPFGWGPRICIGQKFAFMEAKITLTMILQHFLFELSPSYTHAPSMGIDLHPQYGAHIVLRKL